MEVDPVGAPHVLEMKEFHLEGGGDGDARRCFGSRTPYAVPDLLFPLLLLFFHHRPPSNNPTSGARPGLRPAEPYHPLGESDREHDPVGRARPTSTYGYSRACVSTVKFKPRKVMRQGYAPRTRLFWYCRREKERKTCLNAFHVILIYLGTRFLVFFRAEPVAVLTSPLRKLRYLFPVNYNDACIAIQME